MGHLPKVVEAMLVNNQPVQDSGLVVLSDLMNSKVCVRSMSGVENAIRGIMAAMKNCSSVRGLRG